MSQDDNSVNIKGDDRRYHHGDLRSAVEHEGLRLLEVASADSLSLRQIARNVGVSATAIYRHFPDKESLLTALADIGFARLAAAQQSALTGDDPLAFAASGRAYVHFALANPALFRLMFASKPMNVRHGKSAPKGSAAWLLHEGVAHALGQSASEAAIFTGMLRAWSLVHGLALLILDEQVDRTVAEAMIDDIISASSVNIG